MLESFEEIRVFVQVVDSGGLTSAGVVLGMPPNTVSRTIARLEARLGVRLLARTTRRVRATEEGRTFYEHAQRLLDAASAAESAVTPATDEPQGVVRLAVASTTIQYGFVSQLVRLLNEHPKLRVQIVVSDEDVDLVGMGMDLGLGVGDLQDSSISSQLLGRVTAVLAASPKYLAHRGVPKKAGDLVSHECIRVPEDPRHDRHSARAPRARHEHRRQSQQRHSWSASSDVQPGFSLPPPTISIVEVVRGLRDLLATGSFEQSGGVREHDAPLETDPHVGELEGEEREYAGAS